VTHGARRRRWILVAGALVLVLAALAATLLARWPSVRAWYLLRTELELIGRTETGMALYRHRASGLEMVLLPGGEFYRGSDEGAAGFPEERPRHRVRLEPFLIARTEVIQADWRRIAGDRFFLHPGDDLPAHGVTWIECRDLCARVGLSLPTEAEWEYACRAGSETSYSSGVELSSSEANFGLAQGPWPAKHGSPNAFGIFGMHGNVEEWCIDSFRSDAYRDAPKDDAWRSPVSLDTIDAKVARGGGWRSTAEECRSARRSSVPFSSASTTVGLRPVFRLFRVKGLER